MLGVELLLLYILSFFDYVAFIVCRIHAEFGAILSYIRGRSIPFGWQAIRQLAIPTNAHRLLFGSWHITGLPAYSSSVQSCLWNAASVHIEFTVAIEIFSQVAMLLSFN